jgi:hypothetical protein
MLDCAHDGDAPLDMEMDPDSLGEAREYGYAFWFRFLTRYPVDLLVGK